VSKRERILELLEKDLDPKEVAYLCGVTTQYVYRIKNEAGEAETEEASA
jgi:hypothetical protein